MSGAYIEKNRTEVKPPVSHPQNCKEECPYGYDKEAADKSIRIAVRVSKPTLKLFMKALSTVVGKPTK